MFLAGADVNPEIIFIVTYPRPRCLTALEARTGAARGWLRCPSCGRASLPPDHMRTTPRFPPATPGEDVLVIGPSADDRLARRGAASPFRSRSGWARRIALGSLMFLSLIRLFFAVLDQNGGDMVLYGLATLVSLTLFVSATLRR